MSVQSVAAGEGLKVGSVLGRSYRILLGKLATLLVIAVVISSPSYGLYIWLHFDPGALTRVSGTETVWSLGAFSVLTMILEIVLSFVATGMIVYGTLRELQEQPARFVEILRRGLPVLVPVVLVSLAATLAVVLGLVLLVIPGLILSVMYWVAVPVTVIERRGVRASLERSRDLTLGYRVPIFGLLLLSLVTNGGYGYAIGAFLDYETDFLSSLAIEWGGGALLVAYWSVVSAVTYFDLKRIKEGLGIGELAAVFD